MFLRCLSVILFLTVLCAECAVAQLFPFQESFDEAVPPALPAGWSSSDNKTSGKADFVTAAGTSRSSPNAALATNATVSQALRSPPFDFVGWIPDRLDFYTRRSSTFKARLIVEASTEEDSVLTLGDTIGASGSTGYVHSTISLPASLGGRKGVALTWRIIPDVTGASGTFRIDDISLSVRPVHDLGVNSLTIEPPGPMESDPLTAWVTIGNVGGPLDHPAVVRVSRETANGGAELASGMIGALSGGDSLILRMDLGRLDPGICPLVAVVIDTMDQDHSNDTLRSFLRIGYRRGSVAINEIMFAPESPEPEWVEIVNRRSDTLGVQGWSFTDAATASRHVITENVRGLEPGGFAVLTRDSLAFQEVLRLTHVPVVQVPGFPSLNNDGDAAVIFDPSGHVVDSVVYLPWWGGTGGHSLERIDDDASPLGASNWGSSIDPSGGTPGRANSIAILPRDLRAEWLSAAVESGGADVVLHLEVQNAGKSPVPGYGVTFSAGKRDTLRTESVIGRADVPGMLIPGDSAAVTMVWKNAPAGVWELRADIDTAGDGRPGNNGATVRVAVPYQRGVMVINEIMYEPQAGGAEYVEIFNRSRDDVDLESWTVWRHFPSTGKPGGRVLMSASRDPVHAGGYVVAAADSSILDAFPSLRSAEPGAVTIGGWGTFALANAGGEVILSDGSGRVMDSVVYDPHWHRSGIVSPVGHSLERISAVLGSNDPRNWSTSVDPRGGTPGERNSIDMGGASGAGSLSFSPNPFSPDGDGREDFTMIHFEVPMAVALVNIKIFDVRGRLVRWLANNEATGARGNVVWDGRNEARQTVRMGVYVVFLEASDDRGNLRWSARGALVVAHRL